MSKRLHTLWYLVVLGSLGLVLAGCGSGSSVSKTASPSGWRRLPSAPITVNAGLTSIWTGKELIVSGVGAGPDGTFIRSTEVAAAYEPANHAWRRLARPTKTENYCRRGAVWTGNEMLVWGCGQLALDPLTNRWRRLPPAPTGQGIVAWTGRELIGWGGGCCGDAHSDGAAYTPATNTWRKLAPSPLAPEQQPNGAWTGRELVLFVSGRNPADGKPWPARLARAAAYNPATDTWHRIAPLPEPGGTAVWDGRELLVVGGGAQARSALAYNPATNHWRRVASLPARRPGAVAVWTGKRLLLLSGNARHGLAYEPKADRWSAIPRTPLPARDGTTVVWTGHALIVWGGVIGTPVGTSTPPRYARDGAVFTPALESKGGPR